LSAPERRDRYQREREFHNEANVRWGAVEKFYEIAKSARGRYKDLLMSAVAEGSRVLEYGCGEGGNAFALASRGASVTGIDISEVRIQRAIARAEGLGGLTFKVMNAERLEFPDNSFDLICGAAILHHLDLDLALAEVARTLKDDGKAVFLEPLGHNAAINLYRRLTPAYRTPDEHPLLMRDLQLARGYFELVDAEYFHMTVLLATPFWRHRRLRNLGRALERLDDALMRAIPFVQRYAWMVVLSLGEPRRDRPRHR
jgi:ubiquinone/menaquinone biosynthesis C-methylase UbiE